jgi:DNA-binding FrmR family transcriptional regulator
MDLETKESLVSHLKKICGQVTALEKMVTDEQPCLELVQQIRAARSSLGSLEKKILLDKIKRTGAVETELRELERLLEGLIE